MRKKKTKKNMGKQIHIKSVCDECDMQSNRRAPKRCRKNELMKLKSCTTVAIGGTHGAKKKRKVITRLNSIYFENKKGRGKPLKSSEK